MSNDSSKPDPQEVIEAAPEKSRSGLPWGVMSAVVVLVVGFLTAQILSALLVSVYPQMRHWTSAHTNDWLTNSIIAQFVYVLISETILVGSLYAFIRWRKGSLHKLGVRKPRWIDGGYAGVGVLAYFGLYLIAITIVTAFVHINLDQQQDIGFTDPVGGVSLLLTFISLVILPPLAEEFAFRGFLFTTLRGRFGVIAATLGTSALFAVPHLLESSGGGLLWIAGVDTFVLSFVLCFVRQKTGRLWAGIGIHMMKNGVAFLSLYVLHAH
ncbi:MAG TPA: type II CAAX endopeptidase family protein [Candidatus Saccharimonadales bacterium]